MADNNLDFNIRVNNAEQLKNLSSTLRSLVMATNGQAVAAKNLDARQRALSSALGITTKGIGEHAKSVKEAVRNQSALGAESKRLRQDIKRLKDGTIQVNGSSRQMVSNLKSMSRAMRGIKARALVSDLRSLSLQIKKAGKDAQFVGRSLIIGLTTPLLTFANRGLDAFKSLDRELVRMRKILGPGFENFGLTGNEVAQFKELGFAVDDVATKLDAIKKVNRDLSNEFGISRDVITAVTGDFAELGINAADALAGLTKLSTEVSILGTMDMAESQGLVQTMFLGTMRAMDQMGVQFENAADKQRKALQSVTAQMYLFNAIENTTALSFRDMATALPEVTSATVQFGLSFTEAAALLAPMKAAGIDVSTAANGIKVSLQRMVAPTGVAITEMERLEAAFGAANPQMAQAFDDIQGVGMKAIQGLIDVTRVLQEETGQEGVLKFYSKLFQKRQGPRMLLAMQDFVTFQKELEDGSTAAGQFADQMNRIIGSANRAGGATLPLIKNVEDLSAVSKIAVAQVGDVLPTLGRAVTEADKEAARQARRELREYISSEREKGREVIEEITSEAGKAMVIQLAGASSAMDIANQELQTAKDSAAVSIDRIKISLKNVATDMIQTLEPAFIRIADAMRGFADRVANMPDGIKRFVIAIGGMVAALGPLVFIFGQLKLATGVMGGALFKLLPTNKILTAEMAATTPQLLHLRKGLIMSGDGIVNANGRFRTFIATLAGGKGPMSGFARQFGRMTGTLKKDITAAADVRAAVEDARPGSLAGIQRIVTAQNAVVDSTVKAGAQVASAITTAGNQAAASITAASGGAKGAAASKAATGFAAMGAAPTATQQAAAAAKAPVLSPLKQQVVRRKALIDQEKDFLLRSAKRKITDFDPVDPGAPLGPKKDFVQGRMLAQGQNPYAQLRGGAAVKRAKIRRAAEAEYDDLLKKRNRILMQNINKQKALTTLEQKARNNVKAREARAAAAGAQNAQLTADANKKIANQTKARAKAAGRRAAQDKVYAQSGVTRAPSGKFMRGGKVISEAQAQRIAMGGPRGRLTAATQTVSATMSKRASRVSEGRISRGIKAIGRGTEAERALVRQSQIAKGAGGDSLRTIRGQRIKSGIATRAASITGVDKSLTKIKDLNKQASLLGTKGPGAFKKMSVFAGPSAKRMGGLTSKILLGSKALDLFKISSLKASVGMKVMHVKSMLTFASIKSGAMGAAKSVFNLGNVMKVAMLGFGGAAIMAILAGIAAAVLIVIKNFDKIREDVEPGIQILKVALTALKDTGVALLTPFLDLFAAMSGGSEGASQKAEGIAATFNKISAFVLKAANTFKSFVETYVVPFVRKALGALMTIIKGFKRIIQGVFNLKDNFALGFEQIKQGVAKVFRGLIEFFLGTFAPAMVNVLAAALKIVFRLFLQLIENLPKILAVGLKLFLEFRMLVIKVFKFLIMGALKLLAKLPSGLGKVLDGALDLFASFVESVIGFIRNIPFVGDKIVDGVTGGIRGLGGVFTQMGDLASAGLGAAVNAVDGVLDKLIDGMDAATDFIGDKAMDLGSFLSEKIGAALEGVPEKFDGMVDGIKDIALDKLAEFAPKPVAEGAGKEFMEGVGKGAEEEAEEISDEIYEPLVDAGGDAGAEAGEDFAKKFADAFKDLKQKFVDLVGDFLTNKISEVASDLTDALEKQRDAALAVFDDQLDILDKVAQAEESLLRQKEFIANKKKLIDDRELARQNYNRERALAIYEGRIDDARMLGLEDEKSQKEHAQSLDDLQADRNKELRKENLEFLRDQIKEARKEAEDFFKEQVKAFQEASKEITKFSPQTINDYEKQLNALKDEATKFAGANAKEFENTFNKMRDKIRTNMPNKVVGVFEENLDDLVAEARSKYGLNEESDSVIGATLSMLAMMGDTIGSDVGVSTNWNFLLEGMKEEILDTGTGSIAEVIANYGPQAMLAKAIEFAEETILHGWRGTIDHIMSAVDGLAGMMDPMLKEILEAQLAFEALRDAANAAAAASAAAGGGGGGAPQGGQSSVVRTPAQIAAEAARLYEIESAANPSIAGYLVKSKVEAMERASGLSRAVTATLGYMRNRQAQVAVPQQTTRTTAQSAIDASITNALTLASWTNKQTSYGPLMRAYGGYVPGFKSSGIPTMLHGGEYVLNAKAVQNMGRAALDVMNNTRFSTPTSMSGQGAVTTVNKTENINIYVDNFIGEERWFETMMDTYNIKVKPIKEKSRGEEARVFSSYNYRTGR